MSGYSSPRGDLKRQLVADLVAAGIRPTGRARRNLRKALGRLDRQETRARLHAAGIQGSARGRIVR